MEQIKVKYHSEEIEKIQKIHIGDWIDLRASEDVFIPYGEMVLIPLGVSMQLPKGFEGHVVPRSSTFKNFGIIMANHQGVIDNSYCGDDDIWMFPAICLDIRDSIVVYEGTEDEHEILGTFIKKNDRICQFRILEKQPEIEFIEVETLGNENRGGIGSTGKR